MNRCAPFACFRLPGEGRSVHEIGLQYEARAVATTAEELRGQAHLAGFLMAPFAVTAETPMLWIEEEQGEQGASVLQLAECDEAQLESFPPVAPIPQALPDSYRTTFERFMEHLEEEVAEKLVLAHRVELPSIATAQVVESIDALSECFRIALLHASVGAVALCHTGDAPQR